MLLPPIVKSELSLLFEQRNVKHLSLSSHVSVPVTLLTEPRGCWAGAFCGDIKESQGPTFFFFYSGPVMYSMFL